MVFLLLKFAIKEFLDDRDFNNLSKNTINGYTRILEKFHDFCVERNIVDVSDVTSSTIKEFLLYRKNVLKNNPTSLNTNLRGLRTFFNYLANNEVINSKSIPTAKIPYVKEEIKVEVFSDDQIRQMLNYYRRIKYRDKTFVSFRDHTIIIVLLGTGMRLGELVNLKWSEVDFNNEIITVYGKKRMSSSIPMTERLKKELAEYRILVEQHFGQLGEYVFTNYKNKQLTPNAVKMIFKHLKVIMNFKNVRLSAHTFRHTFAHRCLMSGMDVFTLQKMLRHSKLDVTMRYVALWGTALKDQNDKYNPLNNMDI